MLTLNEAGSGFAPPWIAVKMRLEGATDRIGVVEGAAEPKTEAGELLHAWPVDHVAGRVVRPVALLVSDLLPLDPLSRKAMLPNFAGARIAIQ